MKYFLIDTCSWINLINLEEENPQINLLNYWIQEGFIELIVPELIIKEWNEHKINQETKIQAHWNTKQKLLTGFAKEIGNLPLSDYRFEPSLVYNQINSIDNLIQHSKNRVNISDQFKLIILDKTLKPKKAPFHHKGDSTKDAYIYFSALEFCRNNNIQELHFISRNSSDFGKPIGEEKGSPNEIHPDLLIDFPEVTVHYFGEIGKAISELSEILPNPITSDTKSISLIDNNPIKIDRSKPILEQIYEYFSILNREISFVPLHILINNCPLATPTSYQYYSIFTLTTDNDELTNFIETIEIKGNTIKLLENRFYSDVPDYEEKTKKILTSFNNNLIFDIENKKTHKTISIKFDNDIERITPNDNFRKFKFKDAFASIDSYSDDIKELQEKAYLLYHIGNFIDAANTFKLVSKLALEKKLYLTAFISKYNLSKLLIFIRRNYWGENAQDNLINELKEINLSNIASAYKANENSKIINWIISNEFFSISNNEIRSTVSKIIDHYYSSLKGGWSSNSEVLNLINTFAEIESFLNNNYIIYDRFTEFYDLSKNFIEGLFASHAISDNGNSRLEEFDDWMIMQLLVYGDAEHIIKIFNSYKLKKIKYKETSSNGESFNDLINNFFLCNDHIKEEFEKINNKNNRTFWDYYNRIFCNILVLVCICDFDKKYIEFFTIKLLCYLESEKFIHLNNFKYIRMYFQSVGNSLNIRLLKRFFLLTINNSPYHKEDFWETLSDILNERQKKISISLKEFETIKNLAFEECKNCKGKHSNILIIPLYNIIENEDYKKEISQRITKTLIDSFDLRLFYLATLFEIIEFAKEFFNEALDRSYPGNKQVSLRSAFTGIEDNRFNSVNEIINLCFKFGISTNGDEFTKFKEMDDYYEWLLDMDHFDYKKFKPSWIGEYPTRHYFQKIGTNNKVKRFINKYLKSNFNSEIERDYLNIYVRKTWQILKY